MSQILKTFEDKFKHIDYKETSHDTDILRLEQLMASLKEKFDSYNKRFLKNMIKGKMNFTLDPDKMQDSSTNLVDERDVDFKEIRSLERPMPASSKKQTKYIGSGGFRLTTKIGQQKAPSAKRSRMQPKISTHEFDISKFL
jgi:hypothetical protein